MCSASCRPRCPSLQQISRRLQIHTGLPFSCLPVPTCFPSAYLPSLGASTAVFFHAQSTTRILTATDCCTCDPAAITTASCRPHHILLLPPRNPTYTCNWRQPHQSSTKSPSYPSSHKSHCLRHTMASTSAPVAVVHASDAGNPGNKKPASRSFVRPVIPLTYTRRSKPVAASSIQPSSPLRIHTDTAPPTPKQEPQALPPPLPECAPDEPLSNGRTPNEEAPASPLEPEMAGAGATTAADESFASHEESRPVTAGAQTHGTPTPTQSQTTGETTPPGTSSARCACRRSSSRLTAFY